MLLIESACPAVALKRNGAGRPEQDRSR